VVAGSDLQSSYFALDSLPHETVQLDLPITRGANLAMLAGGEQDAPCYTTESAQGYPSLICGPDGVALPHPGIARCCIV
jgi:hypothetical protein